MEQEPCKNAEKTFRTNSKNLLEEMKPILQDFFICELSESGNALLIHLTNGQTFKMTFQEIA